jgi:4'-phosphopantetheinyl transferase
VNKTVQCCGVSPTLSTDHETPVLTSVVDVAPEVWISAINFDESLDSTLDELAEEFLSDSEKSSFSALHHPHRRREWLCARIAGKEAAQSWWAREGTDITTSSVTITSLESGAPVITPAGLSISLAHTTGFAVAAVAASPVGIDVERADRPVRALQRSLTSAEQAECERHGKSPLEVLMAKESAGKSLGIGLAGNPRGFTAKCDGSDWWIRTEHHSARPLRVRIHDHGIHLIAICLQ